MKTIAILQSCYIPWKGFFDIIAAVDEFIIYDDAQYTKNDWRNRNQIKTPQGLLWLTVPVAVSGKLGQAIRDARIEKKEWAKKHWKTLCQYYHKAPYFAQVAAVLEPYYTTRNYEYLSELNRDLIADICGMLKIKTALSYSWDYNLIDGKTERLVDLCRQTGASRYISGPAARSYIDSDLFRQADVELVWFDYAGYPEYPQLWGEFRHNVSIVDLLFNCGSAARNYMKCGAMK